MSTPTQTYSALDGPTASLVANALQQHQPQPPNRPGVGNREADGGWCISWCKDRYWGEVIAAGASITGIVKVRRPDRSYLMYSTVLGSQIIQLSPSHRPATLFTLDPSPQSEKAAPATSSIGDGEVPQLAAVTSVAWAPSCGRSYHLVATGSRDGHVRIWKLKPPAYDEERAHTEDNTWTGVQVADFDHHKAAVGRVEWNVTGQVVVYVRSTFSSD